MTAALEYTADESEVHRRLTLARSDEVLDRLELLRMADQVAVPQSLRDAIRALQLRLGRVDAPASPRTLRAAQHLVFSVQQQLMAANPRNPNPRPHVGRPGGMPQLKSLPKGGRWKFLTLPPRTPKLDEREWLSLIDLTVERAFDRWAYSQHQARRAARHRQGAIAALTAARAAWENYWELACEAEKLLLNRTARRPGGPGARRP